MNFSKEILMQGRQNQEASAETPSNFGMTEGAAIPRETPELSRTNNLMAGQMGARALALMNDPVEVDRTNKWMEQFGLSNQGVEWNQAKMGVTPIA